MTVWECARFALSLAVETSCGLLTEPDSTFFMGFKILAISTPGNVARGHNFLTCI